jgi:hypothetical protein
MFKLRFAENWVSSFSELNSPVLHEDFKKVLSSGIKYGGPRWARSGSPLKFKKFKFFSRYRLGKAEEIVDETLTKRGEGSWLIERLAP